MSALMVLTVHEWSGEEVQGKGQVTSIDEVILQCA